MPRRLLQGIIVLAGIGLVISGYSFLHHESLVPGTFCDISATLNCDIVNRGPFSEIFGIPVGLIGLIGYLFLGLSAALLLRESQEKGLKTFLLLAASGGLAFSLYLTGIETFILRVWCPVCLISQLTILLIFILAICSVAKKEKNSSENL